MFMSLSLQGLNPEACTYWANGLSLFYTPSLPAVVLFICLHRLSLFSLYFPLTSHIAARPPFYYTFPLLDFETSLEITRSSHCSMPTALALLRGMFRSPTDPCHYQLEMFLQSFLQGSFFVCVCKAFSILKPILYSSLGFIYDPITISHKHHFSFFSQIAVCCTRGKRNERKSIKTHAHLVLHSV